MVMCIEDGNAYIEEKRKFENLIVTKHEFGRLVFILDVRPMTIFDSKDFIDDIKEIDDDIKLFVNCDFKITFDYFITTNLLPQIRALVDKYTNNYYKGKLDYWKFSDK